MAKFLHPLQFGLVTSRTHVHLPDDASYVLGPHLTRFGLVVSCSTDTVGGGDFCTGGGDDGGGDGEEV